MSNVSENIEVLDLGRVTLLDVLGTDETPAQIARSSYANFEKEFTPEQNYALNDYLLRHRHTSPFEFITLRFQFKMPIFVARQFVRHRTAVMNEVSARYTVLEDNFYVPEEKRLQKKATNNKQGSSNELVDNPTFTQITIEDVCTKGFEEYQTLIKDELAPELARIVLPLSTYTEFVWQVNMHNLLHLLSLRMDSHAQYEIRVYADAMFELVKKHFPNIIASWENHVFNAVTFSRDELTVMSVIPQNEWRQSSLLTSSRQKEFIAKLDKAGF